MSKVTPINSRDVIRAEAQRWVIVFNKEAGPSQEDIERVRSWARQSTVHREELEMATKFWSDANSLSILAVSGTTRFRSKPFFRKYLSYLLKAPVHYHSSGIALILLAGLMAVLWPWLISPEQANDNGIYNTLVGEQKTVVLSDNTVIHMDTYTKLRVRYTDTERRIDLIDGQAHFDVTKNKQRPFDVYTTYGLVRAVGTAFSVSLLGRRNIKVIVDEGKVELARLNPMPPAVEKADNENIKPDAITISPVVPVQAATFVSLEKGQAASFDSQVHTVRDLPDEELSRQLAWSQGLLVFDNKPLRDVIAEVGRYTDVKIEIIDSALADLKVGGRFRVGRLDALLEALDVGFGVEVRRVNERHIHLSSRSYGIE